jgi:hypothetical protein
MKMVISDREFYIDIVPANNQMLSFSNKNHIDYNLNYKFGYNWSGGFYVEYPDNTAIQAHLILDRVYSNYDNIGSKKALLDKE